MSGFGFEDMSGTRARVEPEEEAAADRAAEGRGFVAREPDPAPPARRHRQPLRTAPTSQFNLRAAVEDIDAFIEYCERHNVSYREAFAKAVRGLKRGG